MSTHGLNQSAPTPEEIDWYTTAWRRILRNILNWRDGQIEARIKSMSPVLYSPWLTHDHTSWYIAPLIVPPSLKEKLGPRHNQFCADIVHAIEGQDLNLADPDYDWAAARQRIEALLAPYGESIPREH